MSQATLLASAALTVLTAAVYLYLGRLVNRRPLDGAAKRAIWAFAAWWVGLGLVTLADSTALLLAASGIATVPVHVTVTHVTVAGLTVGLAGLLYYLLYVYTGNEGVAWPVAAFYAVFYVVTMYYLNATQAAGVTVSDWSVSVDYAQRSGGVLLSLILGMLILPILFAAIGYGSLFFQVESRSQRFRVGMVSGAFIVWFGSALLAQVTGFNEAAYWPVASQVIALLAPLAIILAFNPPSWLKNRLDVESFTRPPGEPRQRGSNV